MSERSPRGFTEDTNATPLLNLNSAVAPGPKRPCLVVVAGARLGEIFPIDGEVVIGRDPTATLRLSEDESVSRRHALVKVAEGGALITDLGSANGTWVDGQRVTERLMREGEKIRVGRTHVLKFAFYDQLEEEAQRQLLESALRDGQTGAFNRRYFRQRLLAELRFAERHGQSLALLMIDIDHFKQVNDQRGHIVGDEVLCHLVALFQGTLRVEDVLARYGGEEFTILARNMDLAQSSAVAERLRQLVSSTDFGGEAQPLHVTVSVGVAIFPEGDLRGEAAAEQLLQRADAALYRAKNAGRDRVAQ